MAPLVPDQLVGLEKRQGCPSGYYYGGDGLCYRYNTWNWWGRWVFAGLAVLFVLLVFALLFRNSRRRRKQGGQPLYGTGWMAPAPQYYPPPPQYSAQDQNPPPPGGYKYNGNDGYYGNPQAGSQYGSPGPYGNQQEGIQLQQPEHAYHRGGDADYAPPPGPPPNAATKP
ncbi:chitin synthesis regulation, resistance to congo red-domain-containing protein [Apiosordaria backusii]|uniref:Chitin synthesis regulation, resistance to congo red-domain-containing protein n=1 Tax=Apiosordaria backusii TaxID=314023 RepID=A0AA40K6U6_9PEZI|nr:chitin synthesis regulation, resistance to congo red-domain-containing protein [Apiosordaria backusii]